MNVGIRIEKDHAKTNNAYWAWRMDAVWTERRRLRNTVREDVELIPVHNDAYKQITVGVATHQRHPNLGPENTGNVFEAWAGTLWFAQRALGL
jgi:hypothetical protein